MSPAEKFARLSGSAVPAGCVWLGLGSAMAAEAAGRAGARLAVVDDEHGEVGERLADVLRALALTGCGAIVRVGDPAPAAIKRALDQGAGGLLVPQVEDAATARAVVAAALFPPRGRRGSALAVVRAAGFGTEATYGAAWNARAFIAMQIESRAGLAAVAEIAAVDGVDMLFFGPFDYAADAGLDPAADTAALSDAFAGVVAAAQGAGRLVGVFPWPGMRPADLAAAGAAMIAIASDVRAVVDSVGAGLATLAPSSSRP